MEILSAISDFALWSAQFAATEAAILIDPDCFDSLPSPFGVAVLSPVVSKSAPSPPVKSPFKADIDDGVPPSDELALVEPSKSLLLMPSLFEYLSSAAPAAVASARTISVALVSA